MVDEKFKISGLNAALDEYLSKIDKVNLSRESLLANQKLLEDCIRLSDSLDSKIKAIESSGASAGEKSARASLLSQIKTTALSGGSVDSLLRQEARAVDLTRRGTAASSFPSLSLSERNSLQSLSAGINKSGLGPTFSQVSPAQLRPLLDWSSRSGSAPSRRSMMSYMQESTLSLGSGLDSRIGGDSDHLVTELAAEGRQEKFEESVATIESTSDAILAALGKQRGGTNITVEASKPKKPKKDHGSWWSTLKLLGGIAGTAAALYGILSIPKVQDWIKKNIIDPDGRNNWVSKITDIWEKVVKIAQMTDSSRDFAKGFAKQGYDVYTNKEGGFSEIPAVVSQVDTIKTNLETAPSVDISGLSSADAPLWQTYLAGGMKAAGLVGLALGASKTVGLGTIVKKVMASGPVGWALGGLTATMIWATIRNAQKENMIAAYNRAMFQYVAEHNLGAGWFMIDGYNEPQLISLAQIADESGVSIYNDFTEEEKTGTAFGLISSYERARTASRQAAVAEGLFDAGVPLQGASWLDNDAMNALPAEERKAYFLEGFSNLSDSEKESFVRMNSSAAAGLLMAGKLGSVRLVDETQITGYGDQRTVYGNRPISFFTNQELADYINTYVTSGGSNTVVGNLYPTDRLLPSYIRPSRGSASESIAYAVGRVAVPEQDSRARDANLHNALTLGGMGIAGGGGMATEADRQRLVSEATLTELREQRAATDRILKLLESGSGQSNNSVVSSSDVTVYAGSPRQGNF